MFVCVAAGTSFIHPPFPFSLPFFFLSPPEYFFSFPSCICRLSRQRSLFHSRLMSQLKLMRSVCSDKEERGGKSLSRNNGSFLHIGNQSFLVWAHAKASQYWQLTARLLWRGIFWNQRPKWTRACVPWIAYRCQVAFIVERVYLTFSFSSFTHPWGSITITFPSVG